MNFEDLTPFLRRPDPIPPQVYYDSLGRVVEEEQTYGGNSRYVTGTEFTSSVPAELTYPNDRAVAYNHDEMYRRTDITEASGGSPIAKWSFWGPSRVAELFLGNGLICTHLNNARTNSAVQSPDVPNPGWGDRSSDRLGYDGTGRMITKRYLDATATSSGYTDGETPTEAFVGFTTWYDHSSNKDYERHLHAASRSHLYPEQDSLNRLREYERGELETDATGIAAPISLPGTDKERAYELDGVGNWRKTVYTPVVGGIETTEHRRHNYVNQLTRFGTTDVGYDHGDNTGDDARQGNGNVIDDAARKYAYDALNRLKKAWKIDTPDDVEIAEYTYDAMNRRIRKEVKNGGLPGTLANGKTDFLYSGVQCVEERNPEGGGGSTDTAVRQYVWGLYVDELIQQRDIDGETATEYYLLSDLLYRSVALMDASKNIVEAYDTDAYGRTLAFSLAGGSGWFSDNDTPTNDPTCPFIFTGRRYDSETQIYFYRARYYDPQMGRFLSRDPIGYAGGMGLYEYCSGAPIACTDWRGLRGQGGAGPGVTPWPWTSPYMAPFREVDQVAWQNIMNNTPDDLYNLEGQLAASAYVGSREFQQLPLGDQIFYKIITGYSRTSGPVPQGSLVSPYDERGSDPEFEDWLSRIRAAEVEGIWREAREKAMLLAAERRRRAEATRAERERIARQVIERVYRHLPLDQRPEWAGRAECPLTMTELERLQEKESEAHRIIESMYRGVPVSQRPAWAGGGPSAR